MKKILWGTACSGVWIAAVLIRLQAAAGGQLPAAGAIGYEQQVRPIIEANCLECHSAEKRKGGLSLASYADALEGGRSGPAIRPGKGADSLLVHRITGRIEPQMPKDELALSDVEIATIRAWIDQGARATPSSPPAPQPWEAPLGLVQPPVPASPWPTWTTPIDRFVATYLAARGKDEPTVVSDAAFARRVYLDAWGLLPSPEDLQSFVADRSPDKREQLVARLLGDRDRYAEHWMSFWNDLLRNEDGVSYYSETGGRKSITDWLLNALTTNRPYDQFVTSLLNPAAAGDPEGFLIGVNWRGETSAAVTPWMQASQNSAQVFLGVNLKCNACHDSFISKWKLKDAYGLAAYFSPDPRLQLFRCDVARDEYASPSFLYPELSRPPASSSLADRRAAAAATFTDPRNGRLPRTIVNRLWTRLFGHGIVPNSDEMDAQPWSPELLDWIAADFVAHGYDVKRTIGLMLSSRAYRMPAVARTGEPPVRGYTFAGPELRRMTAEQFADAIGTITGEWSVYQPRTSGAARPPSPNPSLVESDSPTSGAYGRDWRAASDDFTRALGRPIRDQVTSARSGHATTLQALELVNGEILTRWLQRGSRRMLGEVPPEPLSLFNKSAGGRTVTWKSFEIDVSTVRRLWLIVEDTGSNAPERVLPIWADAQLSGPSGSTALSSLVPIDRTGLRTGAVVAADAGAAGAAARAGVRVKNGSRVVYDLSGKGFTRLRATIGLENSAAEVGSTLNPQVRFFVFDAEPDMDRLLPVSGAPPLPPAPAPRTARGIVDRVFRQALGRGPTAIERQLAERALADPARPGGVSADGLADLLWAVVMKPEFQLIY